MTHVVKANGFRPGEIGERRGEGQCDQKRRVVSNRLNRNGQGTRRLQTCLNEFDLMVEEKQSHRRDERLEEKKGDDETVRGEDDQDDKALSGRKKEKVLYLNGLKTLSWTTPRETTFQEVSDGRTEQKVEKTK